MVFSHCMKCFVSKGAVILVFDVYHIAHIKNADVVRVFYFLFKLYSITAGPLRPLT